MHFTLPPTRRIGGKHFFKQLYKSDQTCLNASARKMFFSVCLCVNMLLLLFVIMSVVWPAGWSEWEHSEFENAFNNNLPDFIYHPVWLKVEWKLIWFIHSAILKRIKLFLEGEIFRLFRFKRIFLY